jgi:hypothetical protein
MHKTTDTETVHQTLQNTSWNALHPTEDSMSSLHISNKDRMLHTLEIFTDYEPKSNKRSSRGTPSLIQSYTTLPAQLDPTSSSSAEHGTIPTPHASRNLHRYTTTYDNQQGILQHERTLRRTAEDIWQHPTTIKFTRSKYQHAQVIKVEPYILSTKTRKIPYSDAPLHTDLETNPT